MEIFLDWIYPFQAIFSNFGLSWQKSSLSGAKQAIFRQNLSISGNFQQLWVQLAVKLPPRSQTGFQTGFIHFRQFPTTLVSAGRKAPSQEPNRQFFRLNLSISGNFQQLWDQLAVKLPQGPNRQKFQTGIYSFQAISSNFGFSWQLSPPVGKQRFLFWIYPYHAISSNFVFSWQKSLHPQPRNKWKFFRLNLSISGNFQQLWAQLAENAPPSGQTGKIFRLDLFISGNFQQLWVQLAVKPPFQQENRDFLFWIYPFQAISSNFAFSWQKIPLPVAKQEIFQTGIIHFRQFPATLGSTVKKTSPVAKYGIYFKLDLSISGNFQQICLQLVEKHPFQQPN